jgi:hypothetical protein
LTMRSVVDAVLAVAAVLVRLRLLWELLPR